MHIAHRLLVTQLILEIWEVWTLAFLLCNLKGYPEHPSLCSITETFTVHPSSGKHNSSLSWTSHGLSIPAKAHRSRKRRGCSQRWQMSVCSLSRQNTVGRDEGCSAKGPGHSKTGKMKNIEICLSCLCVSAASYLQTSRVSQCWHPSAQRRSWWWPLMNSLPALTSWQR